MLAREVDDHRVGERAVATVDLGLAALGELRFAQILDRLRHVAVEGVELAFVAYLADRALELTERCAAHAGVEQVPQEVGHVVAGVDDGLKRLEASLGDVEPAAEHPVVRVRRLTCRAAPA